MEWIFSGQQSCSRGSANLKKIVLAIIDSETSCVLAAETFSYLIRI